MKAHILLVEDDAALATILTMHFEEAGHTVYHADNLCSAHALISEKQPDLVILDQGLPDGKGFDLLCTLQKEGSELAIIMMTAEHDLDLAISAIQAGAFDFIHKPIKTEALNHTVDRALEHRQLALQVEELSSTIAIGDDLPKLLGQSEAMLDISREIALLADSQSRVLITGETGTGKELVARAIHTYSERTGPFLAINCAALVESLLESELFGHEKGAFTGASNRKAGKFELATNGTLFLDEIGEMALPIQAKLLRVLQDGLFERVGGSQTLSSNARVVVATNRDLPLEVAAGRFREDLFYRLNTLEITLPPLRERREDLPLLMEGLLQRICRREGRPLVAITPTAKAVAAQYDWPGNIRELENVLTQAVIRGRGVQIDEHGLNLPGFSAPTSVIAETGQPLSLEQLEARHVQFVLDYCAGHKGKACELLKISRPALDRKIERHQLTIKPS